MSALYETVPQNFRDVLAVQPQSPDFLPPIFDVVASYDGRRVQPSVELNATKKVGGVFYAENSDVIDLEFIAKSLSDAGRDPNEATFKLKIFGGKPSGFGESEKVNPVMGFGFEDGVLMYVASAEKIDPNDLAKCAVDAQLKQTQALERISRIGGWSLFNSAGLIENLATYGDPPLGKYNLLFDYIFLTLGTTGLAVDKIRRSRQAKQVMEGVSPVPAHQSNSTELARNFNS